MTPDATAGSSLWQTVFISFAAVLILFEVIRGWRLGLPRQLIRLVAIIAGYAAAFFGGRLLLPGLRPILRMPDVVVSAIGGAILAFVVYALLAGIGALLFKRTAQQSSSPTRLLYGFGGAVLGFLIGGFFILLLLGGIRLVGTVAQSQVHAEPSRPTAPANPPQRPGRPLSRDRQAALSSVDPETVATLLARLKNSVELGPVGEAVRKSDLMPASVYETLEAVGTVFARPENAQRFLSFPGARELSQHPRLVALRTDPEIMEMISQGRLLELLRDPRVIAAANDPTLVEAVKKFDLRRALDYAAGKD